MTTAPPLARYGALAGSFVTAELHHLLGHHRWRIEVENPIHSCRREMNLPQT
ncbi:hypothetical protein [Aurantimonas sp. A3-2-R12]|uniref:hypothetical protein n=1 Tax=Aurantimonas sp. A3-2-R12 TaxID=3114362 RepID=UPI002E16CFDE|nr:hypothetical protein [Aurantimonas sp. A3-2-R12]